MKTRLLGRLALFAITLAGMYVGAVGLGTVVQYDDRSVIERLATVAIQPGEQSYTLTKFREIDRYEDVDVLVLGSSHAEYGYDVRVFEEAGLDAFNIGTLSQAPTNSHYILQRYWDRLAPCMIVYEIYPAHLSKEYSLGPVVDHGANTPPSWDIMRMALVQQSMHAINLLFSAYWQQLIRPLDRVEQQPPQEGHRYVPGGYVEVQDTMQHLDRDDVPPRGEIIDAQVEHLRKTVRFAKEQDTPIVLTTHPLPEEVRDIIVRYDEATARLHEVADDEDVPYLDFNEILPLDPYTYFYDYHHLNAAGARRFTQALLEELKSLDTECLRPTSGEGADGVNASS